MNVTTIQVGPLATNCYLLVDEGTGAGAIVDPGDEGERLVARIRYEAVDLRYIVLTHAHWDHVGAVGQVKDAFPNAEICIGAADAGALRDPAGNLSMLLGADLRAPEADRKLKEGAELMFGTCRLRVLDTPGHTRGGITLVCDDEHPALVFCGDLIFRGAVGRTDFPGGNMQDLMASINDKIMPLEDGAVLYCGHDAATTVGDERRSNPYIRNDDGSRA